MSEPYVEFADETLLALMAAIIASTNLYPLSESIERAEFILDSVRTEK